MPEELKFNKVAYDAGQAMFLRGITLDLLVEQLNRDTKDPYAGRYNEQHGTDEQFQKWADEQAAREEAGVGLVLGYLNGIVQAVRRIDNQLMQSNQ